MINHHDKSDDELVGGFVLVILRHTLFNCRFVCLAVLFRVVCVGQSSKEGSLGRYVEKDEGAGDWIRAVQVAGPGYEEG